MGELRPAFDIAEEADTPETWWTEPRDKSAASEAQRQLGFRRLMSAIAPRVVIYANVNAARRTQWEAAKAKAEGMLAGVSDMTCLWTGGVAWIEFKSGTGRLSPQQREFAERLMRAEQLFAVCRTPEGAARWLRSVGAPVAEVAL